MGEVTQQFRKQFLERQEVLSKLELDFKKDPGTHAGSLAEAYLTEGLPNKAIKVLEKTANGKDANLHVLLAQAFFDTFDNGKSKAKLDDAAKISTLEKNLRAQLLLGELAFEEGKAEDARKHLSRVRELEPESRRAAELLVNLGENIEIPEETIVDAPEGFRTEYESTETFSKMAVQILAGVVVGTLLLAGYYWSAQRAHRAKNLAYEANPLVEMADVLSLQSAIKKYQEILEIDSSHELGLAGLAEAHALLWVVHGLESERGAAISFSEQARGDDIQRSARYSGEILTAYGEGRLAAAEQVAAGVIEQGGVSDKIYYALGLTQRALGKVKMGRDNLRRAQDFNSSAPHYAVALGDAYMEDDDKRNREFYWKIAYQSNSNFIPAAGRVLYTRVMKGEKKEALEAELKRLKALPENMKGPKDIYAITLAEAAMLLQRGQTTETLALVNSTSVEGAQMVALKAKALMAENKIEEGMAAWNRVLELAPGTTFYYFAAVESFSAKEKHDEALALLETKTVDFENDVDYQVAYGNALAAKADYTAAHVSYDKALKLKEDYADALLGKGVADWKSRNYDGARTWLEKAVGAREKFPQVYEAIGLMWLEQGASAQAVMQLKEAEKLFLAAGTDAMRMNHFYATLIRALARHGGTRYISEWVGREKAFRESL